jgi:hypothetical protein
MAALALMERDNLLQLGRLKGSSTLHCHLASGYGPTCSAIPSPSTVCAWLVSAGISSWH